MDDRTRKRSTYVTRKQKKKLMHLLAKYPELITGGKGKLSEGINPQHLWIQVANECNAMPGAKKTWRQWKKSWQDIKSKAKKKQEHSEAEIPTLLMTGDQEVLGLKNVSSTTNYHDGPEFVNSEDILGHNFINEIETSESFSETDEEVLQEKVLSKKQKKIAQPKSEHTNCNFNCDTLAAQEEKKLQIKEDYYSFKKDYLRQKLLILQEQTEALKSIAKVLVK